MAPGSIRPNLGHPTINCVFHDNGTAIVASTPDRNAKPLAGWAIFLKSGTPTFVNCLFYNNKAGEGAAVANGSGVPTFVNCTFAKNHAMIGYGGALNDKWSKTNLRNCIVRDNTAIRVVGRFSMPHRRRTFRTANPLP